MSIPHEILLPKLNDIDISDPNILRSRAKEIREVIEKLELNMKFYKSQSDDCYKKHNIDDGKYNEKKVEKCKQEISHFHDFTSQLIFRSYNLLNTDASIINITGLESEEAIKRIDQRINTLKNQGTLKIKSEDSEYILQEVGHKILTYFQNNNDNIKIEITSSSIILLQLSNNNNNNNNNTDDQEISKELAKETMISESFMYYNNNSESDTNQQQQHSSLIEEKEKLLKEAHEYRHKIEEYKQEIKQLQQQQNQEKENQNQNERIKEIESTIKEYEKKSSEMLYKAYNIFNDNSSIDVREQSYEESIEYIKNGLKDINNNNLKELIIIGDGSDCKYMNEIKKSIITYLKDIEKLNNVKEDDPHEGWIKIVFNEEKENTKINQTPNSSDNSVNGENTCTIDDYDHSSSSTILKSNSTIPPTTILKQSSESNLFPVSPVTSDYNTNENGEKHVGRRRASTAVPERANNPANNGKDMQCCIVM